jgi:endonuclease/exonuclease/phosphatase (EEP) superfamily protein YafD
MEIRNTGADETIKIFTSNVYQHNKEWSKVADQIKKYDSDVLLFTETNKWWVNKLTNVTKSKYRYKVSVPLENTYGMLMLSKIPLLDTKVRYLVDDSIPSIKAKLKLPSGDLIQIFGIHPTPPLPQKNPTSTDRDAELMKIALDSRQSDLPVIVMGDFNDVAWSESTQLFQQISGLLDMRKGRGLFNTYKAGNFILKWPLDHIFISADFRFVDMELGANVDSDHLPIYAEIQLYPKGKSEQIIEGPSKSQLEKARDEVEKARSENTRKEH